MNNHWKREGQKQVSFWIDLDLEEKIQEFISENHMTRSGFIIAAIEEYLKPGSDIKSPGLIKEMTEIKLMIEGLISSKKALIPPKTFISEESHENIEFPERLNSYLRNANLQPSQKNPVKETLLAILNFNGSATSDQIATFRGLKRPESIRRQIAKLVNDGIVVKDTSTVPFRYTIKQ